MGVIGDTLSEARTRRGVDLEQIEAATGIRARYLRAIEQEDWDALPEEFYARSFIRKYARFVDVEPEPLVEEYRRRRGAAGRGPEAPTSPFARTSSRRAQALRRRRRRQGVYAWIGAAAVVAAIVVVIVLLVSGGGGVHGKNAAGKADAGSGAKGVGGRGKGGSGAAGGANGAGAGHNGAAAAAERARGVKLEIEATAEVWACVRGADGKPLVDGLILAAGETAGPFRSRSYTAAFGNGSVQVVVNGTPASTPSSPSPIGLTVDHHGKVRELPEGSRPSCE